MPDDATGGADTLRFSPGSRLRTHGLNNRVLGSPVNTPEREQFERNENDLMNDILETDRHRIAADRKLLSKLNMSLTADKNANDRDLFFETLAPVWA